MREIVRVTVNGTPTSVQAGSTVAVAVLAAGVTGFHRSPAGQPRGPLCGMGICYECRVTVNGVRHVKSCQAVCEPGMDILTDE